ncbi:MAG TPA: NTP transferase domain-containing protein [Vicinamibacteria bacterium]|nr:NTP transferase domain-containing protein [Vicinamibacteria bacterium]
MKDGLRVLAVVPARGGSDSVPYLNIKRLGDKPLLAHTIDAARSAPSIDRIVVSTDDPRVADAAKAAGADVPFLRPSSLARDMSSLKPVIAHAVEQVEAQGDRVDVVLWLQATSPFRSAADIERALDRLLGSGFDSVVSVTEDRTLNWREEDGALVPLFAREGRRDEQPPIFQENGAVVAMRRAVLAGPTRFGDRVGALVLDKRAGFAVHDLTDFWMAERLLREARVVFRTDGGPELGMGHVFRSLAIADVLRGNTRAEIAFLMSAAHPAGVRTVEGHGYDVRTVGPGVEDALAPIRELAPDILINDLPSLDASYLRAVSRFDTTTVNLVDTPDDLEATEQYEHLIVSVMKQERETAESFYGGPEYAILREHFRGRPKLVRDEPRLVLLSFGGSDPQGLTVKAARALRSLPSAIEIVAVAGPAFSDSRALDALLPALPRPLRIEREVGGDRLAELMLDADLMVGSGGMSVYEIAALGTPGVVLAQNEREDKRMAEFARRGTVRYLGLGPDVAEERILAAVEELLRDAALRRAMSARGRDLVDGAGAARAAEAVLANHHRSPLEAGRR